jgi:hypothetical protein
MEPRRIVEFAAVSVLAILIALLWDFLVIPI